MLYISMEGDIGSLRALTPAYKGLSPVPPTLSSSHTQVTAVQKLFK